MEKKILNRVSTIDVYSVVEHYLSISNHNDCSNYQKYYNMIPCDDKYHNMLTEKQNTFKEYLQQAADNNHLIMLGALSSKCDRKNKIKGPLSPLKMNLTPLVFNPDHSILSVTKKSVNFAPLNVSDSGQDRRLLVAEHIQYNCNKSVMTIGHTTMMPGIPELTILLAAAFAPKTPFRTNDEQTT